MAGHHYSLLLFYYCFISFLQGKPLVAQNYKRKLQNCLVVNPILSPVVINTTIMQQNGIKMLHHNGNLLQ